MPEEVYVEGRIAEADTMSGVIPSLSPPDLEKMLSLLPNPNECYFKVRDNTNKMKYTELYTALHETVPQTKAIPLFWANVTLRADYIPEFYLFFHHYADLPTA